VERRPSAELAISLYNELTLRAIELTGNADDAQDLVQDVFVRCLERPPAFRDQQSLLHWLRLVMQNLHIDAARRRKDALNATHSPLPMRSQDRRRDDNELSQQQPTIHVPPLPMRA